MECAYLGNMEYLLSLDNTTRNKNILKFIVREIQFIMYPKLACWMEGHLSWINIIVMSFQKNNLGNQIKISE